MILASIERYERLLETESNEARRYTLHTFLAEACAEACFIMAQRTLDRGDRDLAGDAVRWRMRAEEYTALAGAVQNDGAREAYLRLAQNYATLADSAEARVIGRRDARQQSS
ncbi:MAG: hypothetical protein U1E53_02260 [Dongiaceae bacterium]